MADITYSKTWVAGEVLTAADQNAEFANITAQVNGNLDDSNLSPGAAIKGSKLADAPNGVTTTKINDGAVTDAKVASGIDGAKLTDGTVTTAKIVAKASTPVTIRDPEPPSTQWAFVGGFTTEVTIHSTAITTTRASVLLVGTQVIVSVNISDETLIRLKVDGAVVGIGQLSGGTSGSVATVSLTGIIPSLAAGAHTITVTAQSVVGTGLGGNGQTWAISFA